MYNLTGYIHYAVNDNETLFSGKVVVEGNSNKFMGDGCIVIGNFNRAVVDNIQVIGNYNIVIGTRAKITGNHNIVCGEYPDVMGRNNIVYPKKLPKVFYVSYLDAQELFDTISKDQATTPAILPCIIDNVRSQIVSPTDQDIEKELICEMKWNPRDGIPGFFTKTPWTPKAACFYHVPLPPPQMRDILPLPMDVSARVDLPTPQIKTPNQTDFSSIENKTRSTNDAQQGPKLCVICEDRPADIIALPCRHKKFCSPCILEYQKQSNSKNTKTKMTVCPICKQDADSFSDVYE